MIYYLEYGPSSYNNKNYLEYSTYTNECGDIMQWHGFNYEVAAYPHHSPPHVAITEYFRLTLECINVKP